MTNDPTTQDQSQTSSAGSNQLQPQQAPAQNSAINRIQVKVPPFWKENPALWFKQLEAQFATTGITVDNTQFNMIVGVIESDILSTVSDIVLNPPAVEKYKTIKTRLIKEFTDSDTKKLNKLLNDLVAGDMKPSNLLRRMKELACNKVGEDLLRTLWLQKLPITIQTILSTKTEPLEQLTSLADTMFEVVNCSSVQAVSTSSKNDIDDLVNVIRKLDGKIEAFSKRVSEPSKSRYLTSQSRSPTPTKASSVKQGTFCYYHTHYGKKANKCKKPCAFQLKKSKN